MWLPQPKQHGGSLVGNSYLSLWAKCRRKWFLEYAYPHPDGGSGLSPLVTKKPLLMGSLLHAGKQHWYESGVRDGEDTGQYSLEAALGAVEAHAAQRNQEWATSEEQAEDVAAVKQLLVDFHRHFGPEGHTPLWPETKILCLDDGRPAVELELTAPLGFGDYIYTCRADAFSLYQDRYLRVEEHKTSAPSFVDRVATNLAKTSQFSGEYYMARNSFPDAAMDAIHLHIHIKGWSTRSKFPQPVKFATTTRTAEQLERFRLQAVSLLREIEDTMAQYEQGQAAGVDLPHLMDSLFPEIGERTGECYSYNSTCQFEGLCRMGTRAGVLGAFRPGRSRTPATDISRDES